MSIGEHAALRQKVGDSRVGRPPIRDTDHVGDIFVRLLEARLKVIAPVRTQVAITSTSVERLKTAVPTNTDARLIAVGESHSCRFAAIAVMEAPLVSRLVEAMSGGTAGGSPKGTTRKFTTIDEVLTLSFAEAVMDCFEQAIAPPPRREGEALRFSHYVGALSALLDAPNDTDMLIYRLAMRFDRAADALDLTFLVPLSALEVLQAGDDAARRVLGATAADRHWQRAMVQAGCQAELGLTCVLAQIDMSVGQISDLREGSLIELPIDQTMDVDLRIDQPGGVHDQPVIAQGRLGTASGKRAIRLSAPPAPGLIDMLAPLAGFHQT